METKKRVMIPQGTPAIMASYDVDPDDGYVGITKLERDYRELYVGELAHDLDAASAAIVLAGPLAGEFARHEASLEALRVDGRLIGMEFTLAIKRSYPKRGTRHFMVIDPAPPQFKRLAGHKAPYAPLLWPEHHVVARAAAHRLALALNGIR